ncbi:MAG: 50S ribosomal protein L1 [Alphaproteobacteria bacterium]|nr:50S ribosomal protein L1 [Alphaproteobacteria bacterium]
MQIVKSKAGKKIREARSKIDATKAYQATEAITLLKDLKYTNFDETIELALNLGVDPRHSDQMVRGMVNLPSGTGKSVKVAVFCKEEKYQLAKEAGADIVGGVDLVESIKSGNIDFDVCIASPDMMGMVGSVAKILGPKGLMPNPKLGTVTPDIATAIKNAKSGQVEFRVEKNGIIHAGIGKISFSVTDLLENLKSIVAAVNKAKPSGAKGVYMKKAYMSSTMGPSLQLDLGSAQ